MIDKKITITIIAAIIFFCIISNISATENTLYLRGYEITYSYPQSSVNEGDRFTLTVLIKNVDDIAKTGVVFDIDSSSPFDVQDERWDIISLNSSQTVKNTFRVDVDPNTNEGTYKLEFNLKDDKRNFDDEMDIIVSSNKAEIIIGDIKSSPAIITPDIQNIKLDINLQNIGGGDATFTRASIILPTGFLPTSSYSYSANLGTIASKGNKAATFYINSDKNLDPGINTGKINLEYKDGVDLKETTLEFDLPVKGSPILDISSVKSEPKILIAGTTGKIKVTIINNGKEEGKETSVRIFENSDYPLTFDEKTNFIGNIKPLESGTAIFKTDVKKDAIANTYNIKIQIRTVNNNNVIVTEKTIPITVGKSENNKINPIYFIVIGFTIILVIILIYSIYKIKKQ